MKLYRNWIINEVARAGEHTNEHTYVRTYSHTYVRDRPYIPSTTLLCEGITITPRVYWDQHPRNSTPRFTLSRTRCFELWIRHICALHRYNRDWNERVSVSLGPTVFALDQLIAISASPLVQSILEEPFGLLWSIPQSNIPAWTCFLSGLLISCYRFFCPMNSIHAVYPPLTSQYGGACEWWKQKKFSCEFKHITSSAKEKKRKRMPKKKR